jgi:hypothetical protein
MTNIAMASIPVPVAISTPVKSPKAVDYAKSEGTVTTASVPVPEVQTKSTSGGTGEAEPSGLEWAKLQGATKDADWGKQAAMELQNKSLFGQEEVFNAEKVAGELQSKPMRVRMDVASPNIITPIDEFVDVGDGEEEDGPGIYRTTHRGVVVRAEVSMDSEKLTKMAEGVTFKVAEVCQLRQEQRLRARIEKPAGWITIVNLETGERWASRAARVRSDKPEQGNQGGCGCLAMMNRNKLSTKIEKKVLDLFNQLDADGSGVITKDEALKFFKNSFGTVSANAMFNEVDYDHDEGIQQAEFISFWLQVKQSGYSDRDLEDELDVLMEGGTWVDWKDGRSTGNDAGKQARSKNY